MNNSRSISVIVPVYNEKDLIKKSIAEMSRFFGDNFEDHEIIIVESGSTDGSREICDIVSNGLPDIRVLHEVARNGFGSAIKLGFKNATKDLVCAITVDMPFALDHILDALPLFDDYDCVLSFRSKDERSLSRKVQSLIYNGIINLALGLRVKHVNSAFKMFKRGVVQGMELSSSGWFIDAEIIYNIKKMKVPCTQIPVPLISRREGRSTVSAFTFILVMKELMLFLKIKDKK